MTTLNDITNKLTNDATARGLVHTNRDPRNGETYEERQVNRLQNVLALLEGDIYELTYDIPTRFNDRAPNPSKRFFAAGAFRLTFSCWCMPQRVLDSRIVQDELALWATIPAEVEMVRIAGVEYPVSVAITVRKLKYHEDQKEEIRKIAREELRKAIIQLHESVMARLCSADDNLRATQEAWATRVEQGGEVATELEQETAANRHRNAARGALRDAVRDFESALKCIAHYDTDEELATLFCAVRSVIKAQVSAFNARVASEGYALLNDAAI